MSPQPLSRIIDIYSEVALSMLNEMGIDEDMDDEQDSEKKDPSKYSTASEPTRDGNFAPSSQPTEEAPVSLS